MMWNQDTLVEPQNHLLVLVVGEINADVFPLARIRRARLMQAVNQFVEYFFVVNEDLQLPRPVPRPPPPRTATTEPTLSSRFV